MGELYHSVFDRLYALKAIGLRYFNVFGPGQDPNSQYAAVIPKFITRMLDGQAPEIYGNGLQSRDFTYIDNVVSANILACFAADEACGKVYNVACGENHSLIDLVDLINAHLGSSITPLLSSPRAGDVQHSLASIEQAQKYLNYQPHIYFNEGVKQTIAYWQKANSVTACS